MKTTTTKRKTTRRTAGLNGAVTEKKLTKKQKEFIELAHQARGMFKEHFRKGLMTHPER